MKDKPDDPMKDPAKDNPFSEMSEQAVKNCEQALRCGLKMQQGAAQWWTDWLNQNAPATEDWQKRFSKFSNAANDFMPAAQKRMEEVCQLIEKNTRTGTDLVKKAADAIQAPAVADSQAKWMDFWNSSIRAASSNVEAVSQINTRAVDSWIDFMQKNAEVPRMAKAA